MAFQALAAKAETEGDELTALRVWREMGATLNPDDADDRKWFLLANKKVIDLTTQIQERRAFVENQLRRAATAYRAGRTSDAMAIQSMLRDRYGHYTDLADLFGPVSEDEDQEAETGAETAAESSPEPEVSKADDAR